MTRFTDNLIDVVMVEWAFFGSPTWNLDGTTTDGKKEYSDGAWQRIGEYWRQLYGPYAHLTGKDRGYPWSAAFVSFCMREAGADDKFRYSASHATYINASILASRKEEDGAPFTAESPKAVSLKVGDLIGYWRGDQRITIENAISVGWYQSHTDIVVNVGKRSAHVVGGNVGHSVTRKEVRLNPEGKLIDTRYPWFVVIQNNL